MAIIGSVIKRSFELRERLPQIRKKDGYKQQTKVLKKLLAKAEFTAFGEHYNFFKTFVCCLYPSFLRILGNLSLNSNDRFITEPMIAIL